MTALNHNRNPAQRPLRGYEPVLVDATPLQSEHRRRGVGTVVRAFISASERALERRPSYLVSSVGDSPEIVPADRRVMVWRPHRPAQLYWLYNEAALRAALLRVRPRIFFAPDFNGLVANPFGKTVAVLHDLTHIQLVRARLHRSRGPSERLSDLRWWAYHRKLRRADLLLTTTRKVRLDAIRLLGIPADRIVVVAPGFDRATFQPSYQDGPYRDRGPYFVHVGSFDANKNQRRILEAFARLDAADTHLYFAGGWPPGAKAWLQNESARLGVGARARHLGFVPDEELASLYGNAVAVVFPSLEEGFGLPVLEGMASGGPVITSNRSSMPEVAGDAALLVDPLDSAGIAAAMQRLLADGPLRESLRQRGYAHAQGFSWQALAEQTWELLDAVAAEESSLDRTQSRIAPARQS